jgi:hypothetical protein
MAMAGHAPTCETAPTLKPHERGLMHYEETLPRTSCLGLKGSGTACALVPGLLHQASDFVAHQEHCPAWHLFIVQLI